MRIHLYTRCYNDADMLPYFFRHYDRLVCRYVVYDDESTDDSLSILRSHPLVDLRAMPPPSDPQSRVASQADLMSFHWKESRREADWVIVTDIDEFIYRADILKYIELCRASGVTIIPSLGYQMISPDFPRSDENLTDLVRMGAAYPKFNKMNIFNPDAVEETNFAKGRHTAEPSGHIVRPEKDELLLLHYKYLDMERLHLRHQAYQQRQRPLDVRKSWGKQYSWDREELRRSWQSFESRMFDVLGSERPPSEDPSANRWWMAYPSVEVRSHDVRPVSPDRA